MNDRVLDLMKAGYRDGLSKEQESEITKGNPNVLWVCDVPNWAYDVNAKNVCDVLDYKYNFAHLYVRDGDKKIGFVEDTELYKSRDWDIIISHNLKATRATFKHPDADNIILKVSGHRSFMVHEKGESWIDYNRYGPMMKDRFMICVNNELREKLKHLSKNVCTIHNGVDLNLFHPELKPNNMQTTIGFVGNIQPYSRAKYKGYPLLDVACDELGIMLKGCYFNTKVWQPVRSYHKMPHFYNMCDCIVLPSEGEGCSNTVMEALACGTPVIATKTGWHGEFLEHRKNVYFVDRKVDDLKEAILEVLFTDLKDKLSKNGRKFAEKYHRMNDCAKRWDEAFERFLKWKK